MQILYLLAIDGLRYGVWKDEIESVQRLETIHQIPFSPPHVSGMVMLDKRGTALVDLAFILGQQEFDRDGAGFFFQVAGQDLQTGFVVAEEMTELEVNEQGIVELSDFIKTPHISTCIINGQQAIPVINIATLYQDVLSGNVEPVSPSFSLSLQTSEKDKAPAAIRLFEVGGELFAFNAEHVKADLASPTHIFPIANAPTFLLGLAAVGNSVLPIIDTAGRLALPLDRQACQIVIAEVDDQQFGFLISEDLGIKREDDFTIKMLTPLAESVWITSLAVTEEAIIPILKAPELVHSKEEGRQSILAERYEPDFTFIDKFEHEEVEVAEFLLLGAIHALPKLEVRDVMAVGSVRRLPNLQTLVIGVVQSGDEIVPVLDLAMVFGRRSIIGPDWQMLFVHNGDFKAFVVTEEVIGERTIPKNSQKDMPISLPQKLVYGCYPDKNIARLILNIEAIAVHFDKVIVEEFINTLTKEMMTAPAEIVHALLPDPHKERVVVQETSWKQDESDAGHLTEDGPEVEEFIDETAMVVDESDAGIGDVIVRHEEKSDVLGEDTVLVLDSSLEIEDEEFAQAEELTLQSKLLEKLGSEEDGEGERMEEACDFEVAPLLHEIEIGDDEEPELKARKQAEAEEAAQAEEERQRQEREEQKRQEEEARKQAEAEEAARAEEERQRQEEEEQKRQEEEARKQAEAEEAARAEEERQRQEEEEQKRQEEEARKQIEAEAAARAEEERQRQEEEEQKRQEEEARKQVEAEEAARAGEERQRQEEEEQERQEEEARKQAEAEEAARAGEERQRQEREEQERQEEEARKKAEAEEAARAEEERQRQEEEVQTVFFKEIKEVEVAVQEVREMFEAKVVRQKSGRKQGPPSHKQVAVERGGAGLDISAADGNERSEKVFVASGKSRIDASCRRSAKRKTVMWILLALALALLAAYFIFQQKIEMLPPAPVKESVLPAEPVDLGGSQPAITREMTPEAGDEKRQGAAVASAEEKPILIEEVLPEIQVDLGTIEPPVTHEADTAAEEEKKSVAAMTPPGEERAAIIMVVPADIRTKLELYVVEQGDTLWDISGKMTGDPFNFLKVADENKIDNPDLIFPAQKIVIQKEPASAIEQETEHVP